MMGLLDPLMDYHLNMAPSEIIGTLRSGLDYEVEAEGEDDIDADEDEDAAPH